jgi:hypothetical protein
VKLRATILASAGALALAAFTVGAAQAAAPADFAGVLSADYGHLDANNGGGSGNSWGINGSGEFGLGGSGFAGEIDGGYRNLSGGGLHANDWSIDGSVFWHMTHGRLGAVVGYNSVDVSGGGTGHLTNYGGFGEWFAGSNVNLGLKAGGFTGSNHTDGDYLGAAATFYAMPDLAITGAYDYTHVQHFGNENDWTIKGEWLVSEKTPVSLFAGYTNSHITGGDSANIWFIGVKLYTNGDGSSTLVDRQRNGAATWGTSFTATRF